MIQVADASDIDIFLKRSNKFHGQMKEIYDVILKLQKNNLYQMAELH